MTGHSVRGGAAGLVVVAMIVGGCGVIPGHSESLPVLAPPKPSVLTVAPTTTTVAPTTTTTEPPNLARGIAPTAQSFVPPGPYASGFETEQIPGGPLLDLWYPSALSSVQGHTKATYDVRDWLPPSLASQLPPAVDTSFVMNAYSRTKAANGRFPLVVFGLGYAGIPVESSFLTTHLATWGFVVAAPDFSDRDLSAVLSGAPSNDNSDVADVQKTIDFLTLANSNPTSVLDGHIDVGKIAAIGHSDGARTAVLAAGDGRVAGFIGLAGAAGASSDGPDGEAAPPKPGMILAGSVDGVAPPAQLRAAYDTMRAPKYFVEISGAGHLAFTDTCLIAQAQGGIFNALKDVGVPIPPALLAFSSDGCSPTNLGIVQGWHVIDQAVVAQLRLFMGIDHSRAGLDHLGTAFPGVAVVSELD
ncbi:MAG: alpha/beta hydrolase family protein [Acidimicrobiales bacterium]